MSDRDEFVGRVRGLLISLSGTLSAEEGAEVEHLIEHDEVGEALRTLAWIIVEEDKRISQQAYDAIRELSASLVAEEHMPRDLSAYIAPGALPP